MDLQQRKKSIQDRKRNFNWDRSKEQRDVQEQFEQTHQRSPTMKEREEISIVISRKYQPLIEELHKECEEHVGHVYTFDTNNGLGWTLFSCVYCGHRRSEFTGDFTVDDHLL